jgi:hypothetical protein
MVSDIDAHNLSETYTDRPHQCTGITDDSDAINRAISDGNRCGPAVCDSSTDTPAVVYIPSGTYLIGKPIIFYYMTQLIGNPRSLPVLKAAPYLQALALIDASPYGSDGNAGWTSTNIFLRQIRNVDTRLSRYSLASFSGNNDPKCQDSHDAGFELQACWNIC